MLMSSDEKQYFITLWYPMAVPHIKFPKTIILCSGAAQSKCNIFNWLSRNTPDY